MASLLALLETRKSKGAHLKLLRDAIHHHDRAKVFGHFDAELTLNRHHLHHETVTSLTPLEGVLCIRTNHQIDHFGIRVQFESAIRVIDETNTCDDGFSINPKYFNTLIAGSFEAKENQFYYSPIAAQINGLSDDHGHGRIRKVERRLSIPPGTHTYPFQITLPDDNLPAPFQNSFGNLQYQIVCYFRDISTYISIAETAVNFKGNYNLAKLPLTNEPIISSKSVILEGLWCESPIGDIYGSFIVRNTPPGFLPGEDINFAILIKNPYLSTASDFSVALIRRLTFYFSKTPKVSELIVNTFYLNQSSKEGDIKWEGKLKVPLESAPSYEEKPIYNVTYHLKYEATLEGFVKKLQGMVKINVGTHRRSITFETSGAKRSCNVGGATLNPGRSRSNSVMSTPLSSLPPSYSQLSSRSSSFATLPPHYDDLV